MKSNSIVAGGRSWQRLSVVVHVLGFVAAVLISSLVGSWAHADTRNLLPSMVAPIDPTSRYIVDHLNKPYGIPYLAARYQHPTSTTSPMQFTNTYNTSGNTGLPYLRYQRGPIGGGLPQSTYQIMGSSTSAGVLMRSWDSMPMAQQPGAPADASKHTIYEIQFSNPAPIFSANSSDNVLSIEADAHVHQWEQWSMVDNGPVHGVTAGQFALVLQLFDQNGHKLEYVIYMYDSNLSTYDGNETYGSDSGSGGFVISSFRKDKTTNLNLVTLDASSDGFHSAPWAYNTHFKVNLTAANLLAAINLMNSSSPGALSTDLSGYKLGLVGINTEVYQSDSSDATVIGTSYANLKVTETYTTNAPPPSATCSVSDTINGITVTKSTLTESEAAQLVRTITSNLSSAPIWASGTNNGNPISEVLTGTTNVNGNFTWSPCGTTPGALCKKGNTYSRAFKLKDSGGVTKCTTNAIAYTITSSSPPPPPPPTPTCSLTDTINGVNSPGPYYTEATAAQLLRTVSSNSPDYTIWNFGTNDGVSITPSQIAVVPTSGSYQWYPCGTVPGAVCISGHTYVRGFTIRNSAGSTVCTTPAKTMYMQ